MAKIYGNIRGRPITDPDDPEAKKFLNELDEWMEENGVFRRR